MRAHLPPTSILKAAGFVAFFSLSAHGAVLFSDNFESYSASGTLTNSGAWNTATGPNGYRTVLDQTTAIPFGSPNQYVRLADTGTASSPTAQFIRLQSPQYAAAANALTTLSFDFYEPASETLNNSIGFGYAITNGDLNGAGSRLRLTLNNGLIGGGLAGGTNAYDTDTSYTMFLIFNDTASPVSYAGGTIAGSSAHVWFRDLDGGSPVFAGSVGATNSQASAYTIGFRTFNADVQELWVDNVSLFEGAPVIPEPSTALAGILLMLPILRRRRN